MLVFQKSVKDFTVKANLGYTYLRVVCAQWGIGGSPQNICNLIKRTPLIPTLKHLHYLKAYIHINKCTKIQNRSCVSSALATHQESPLLAVVKTGGVRTSSAAVFSKPFLKQHNLKKVEDKISYGFKGGDKQVVSITYEEIGFFPRSFGRVFDRFIKQLFSDVENLVIQEYRFYRYLFLTTVKCVFILLFVPFLVNLLSKNYIIRPLTEYCWNQQQNEIFLNSYQQKHAFVELQNFEEKVYFESLVIPKNNISKTDYLWPSKAVIGNRPFKNGMKPIALPSDSDFDSDYYASLRRTELPILNGWRSISQSEKRSHLKTQAAFLKLQPIGAEGMLGYNLRFPFPILNGCLQWSPRSSHLLGNQRLPKDASPFKIGTKEEAMQSMRKHTDNNGKKILQEKTIQLAINYNNASIEAISCMFADLISLSVFGWLLILMEVQISVSRLFILEVFFGLDDTKKSLIILLVTDLLVGYHSVGPWSIFFESLFNRYGLPNSQAAIYLLTGSLPVIMDVFFKYLIFRHLNRASPASVATYHAMIE